MKHKEAVLENKIELIKVRNKTLKKNREREEKSIKNLKSLFKHIKDKHILENDAASRLTNEFGNLLAPLLQNEKKNKDKSAHGRRYSEDVKWFAITMHYYSLKAYGYCKFVSFNFYFLLINSFSKYERFYVCIF